MAFNARAARDLATNAKVNISAALKIIKNHAKDGEIEANIASDLIDGKPDAVIKELKSLGFKAEYVSDQRDGDYYQVSW